MAAKTVAHVYPRDLPADYYRHVGEVAVRWSRVALLLQEIVWAVMGLSRKDGLLLTCEQGAKDNIQMFKGLVKQSLPGRFAPAELEEIANEVQRLMTERNNIVHGVFGHAPDRPRELELLYAQRSKDKVVIRAEPKTADDIKQIGADITALQQALEDIRERLAVP